MIPTSSSNLPPKAVCRRQARNSSVTQLLSHGHAHGRPRSDDRVRSEAHADSLDPFEITSPLRHARLRNRHLFPSSAAGRLPRTSRITRRRRLRSWLRPPYRTESSSPGASFFGEARLGGHAPEGKDLALRCRCCISRRVLASGLRGRRGHICDQKRAILVHSPPLWTCRQA